MPTGYKQAFPPERDGSPVRGFVKGKDFYRKGKGMDKGFAKGGKGKGKDGIDKVWFPGKGAPDLGKIGFDKGRIDFDKGKGGFDKGGFDKGGIDKGKGKFGKGGFDKGGFYMGGFDSGKFEDDGFDTSRKGWQKDDDFGKIGGKGKVGKDKGGSVALY